MVRIYKATPRFHFRKKTAWEMGKEKWSYTQKWSEAGKEFPILCERIKCNRSKSNFATFKCQKGPSIDFDPPRVLVLLLFALWFLCFLRKWSLGHFNYPYIFINLLSKTLVLRFEFRSSDRKSIFSLTTRLDQPKSYSAELLSGRRCHG